MRLIYVLLRLIYSNLFNISFKINLCIVIYLITVNLYGSDRVLTSFWAMQRRIVTSKWHIYSFFPPHFVPSGSVFGHVWGGFSSNLMQNDIVLFQFIHYWDTIISFWS